MIFETLQVLKEEVDNYFLNSNIASTVMLSNIGTVEADSDVNTDSSDVLLSLVNIQEEYTLKNTSNNYISGDNVSYRNPKIYLNLFVLFGITMNTYSEALKRLSFIVEFFQGKRTFTQGNSIYKREGDMFDIGDFSIVVELYTPTFEELNYIWGTLGGKQYPSVLYKVRLLEIDQDRVTGSGKVIKGLTNTLSQ